MQGKRQPQHRDKFIDPEYKQSNGDKLNVLDCKKILDDLICDNQSMQAKIDHLVNDSVAKTPCPKCQSNRTYYCSKCHVCLLEKDKMPFFRFPIESVVFRNKIPAFVRKGRQELGVSTAVPHLQLQTADLPRGQSRCLQHSPRARHLHFVPAQRRGRLIRRLSKK
jgi:hypothetical protein